MQCLFLCHTTGVSEFNGQQLLGAKVVMAKKRKQSSCSVEFLTDEEISASIHYLDSSAHWEGSAPYDYATSVICLSLIFSFLGFAVFILLHHCAS
jgi:hypothetical protein